MNCGRCLECMYWEPGSAWQVPCEYETMKPAAGVWGFCERMASTYGRLEDAASLAMAKDEDSYGAQVVTRSDFGCVMFEAKDRAEGVRR